MRVADHGHGVAVQKWDRLAVQLVGGRAVELEVARGRGRVGAALADRLAGVARLQRAQLLRIRRDCLAELHQQPTALGRSEAPPRRLERLSRRPHCPVDVGRAGPRDPREGPAVRRAQHVDRAPVFGLPRLAPDQVVVSLGPGSHLLRRPNHLICVHDDLFRTAPISDADNDL